MSANNRHTHFGRITKLQTDYLTVSEMRDNLKFLTIVTPWGNDLDKKKRRREDEIFEEIIRAMREITEMISEGGIDLRDLLERINKESLLGFRYVYTPGKSRIEVLDDRGWREIPIEDELQEEVPNVSDHETSDQSVGKEFSVSKVLETKSTKVVTPTEVKLLILAPDVEEKDVKIRKIGNSIEVMCKRRDGSGYFETMEVPEDISIDEMTISKRDGKYIEIRIPRIIS